MMEIRKIILEPTYKKESGLWVFNIDKVKLPEDFIVKERNIVSIPPGQIGGNHKHPRMEAFIGGGDLEIAWLDEQNKLHRESMEKDDIVLFVVPPYLPHAILNRSKTITATLMEWANDLQHDVETVEVIKPS